MALRPSIEHRFVKFVPEDVDEGVLYVSIEYGTVVHKCACGCGSEVVTPLSPTDWKLTFDGETVTLYPSIGSWSLPCESHYIIYRNRVRWARRWSKDEIEGGRERNAALKRAYQSGVSVDEFDELASSEDDDDRDPNR